MPTGRAIKRKARAEGTKDKMFCRARAYLSRVDTLVSPNVFASRYAGYLIQKDHWLKVGQCYCLLLSVVPYITFLQEPLSNLVHTLMGSGIYNKWVQDELVIFGDELYGPGFARRRQR